jgi:hypothetical protein
MSALSGSPVKLPAEISGIEMLYQKTDEVVLSQTLQNSNDKHKSHDAIEITEKLGPAL